MFRLAVGFGILIVASTTLACGAAQKSSADQADEGQTFIAASTASQQALGVTRWHLGIPQDNRMVVTGLDTDDHARCVIGLSQWGDGTSIDGFNVYVGSDGAVERAAVLRYAIRDGQTYVSRNELTEGSEALSAIRAMQADLAIGAPAREVRSSLGPRSLPSAGSVQPLKAGVSAWSSVDGLMNEIASGDPLGGVIPGGLENVKRPRGPAQTNPTTPGLTEGDVALTCAEQRARGGILDGIGRNCSVADKISECTGGDCAPAVTCGSFWDRVSAANGAACAEPSTWMFANE